jgi:hypothetical protein
MADIRRLIEVLITAKDTTGPAAQSAATGVGGLTPKVDRMAIGLIGAASAAAVFGAALQ